MRITTMTTKQADPHYRAYLLRLWRKDGEGSWRASLQSTATEHFQHFADIEALFGFLLAQLEPGEGECKPSCEHENDNADA